MPQPLNSLIFGLSNDAYHSSEGISKSGLDLIARSPAHYRYAPKREPSPAMLIGTATHCAILEPERYATEYVVLKDAPDRRSSVYKEAVKERGGEFVLLQSEADRITGMVEAVYSNVFARDILADGDAEVSLFAKDPVTGVSVRVRFDWLRGKTMGGIHRPLDLKTTQDASDEAFGKSVWNYRYHVQDVFYCDVYEWAFGEQPAPMEFLTVESDMPHGCTIHRIPHDFRQYARKLYRADLNRYAECLESGHWPGIDGAPHVTQMPGWAVAIVENDSEIIV